MTRTHWDTNRQRRTTMTSAHLERRYKKGQSLVLSNTTLSRPKSFSRHHRCNNSLKKKGFYPAPRKNQVQPITEYSKCCVMIQNTSFRHSDVLPFCLTLPVGTWGEIKILIFNIRYDPFSTHRGQIKISGVFGLELECWGLSYLPHSFTQRLSVLICPEASADRCGWAWPWCFITCFFSTVYCWNWSWRYCSFPHKWAGAREGSPSCCTLEGEWENRKWGQEWRFPL